jgi:threonine/homoserine/homoserine lactone efflux protein
MLLPLLIGFAFGFVGSMPVAGPISVLVLHLGLAHDSRHGVYVAVGGALAESIYALLAFWGLSTVLASYPRVLPVSRTLGAGLLLALGLVMLLGRIRPAPPQDAPPRGNKRSLLLGFLITAVNPTLIVTWTAAVTALNATGLLVMDRAQALPFAAAVGAGIVAWFLTLLWLVNKWRTRLSPEAMRRFRRGMGAILVALGGWMGLRALLLALHR